jgi:apolipoprotein N-acyltransferase
LADGAKGLGVARGAGVAALGTLAFHAAFLWPAAGPLIIVYLLCVYRLAWLPSARSAVYIGFATGLAAFAPQLSFFYGIFGAGALALWAVLAAWITAFVVLARTVVQRWPKHGPLLLPILWTGLEYFRSEMYYLRFSWLSPGYAVTHPDWVPMTSFGIYGFSFIILCAAAVATVWCRCGAWLPGSLACLLLLGAFPFTSPTVPSGTPVVAGVQLEFPRPQQVMAGLNTALQAQPDADLLVLSEYTFDGEVTDEVRQWCDENDVYLVVGGKDYHDVTRTFFNTAYVVDDNGLIVFQQAKSVPIQFFDDGEPAFMQSVWESPWGPIGIAICYDLSYSRVIDRLIDLGAGALIVPTMDVEAWGRHEHNLHAGVAPVRAREYGVPIFRVASSGASQLVGSDGRVRASAPFPGPMRTLSGKLPVCPTAARKPLDRYIVIPAMIITVALLFMFPAERVRRYWLSRSRSSSRPTGSATASSERTISP